MPQSVDATTIQQWIEQLANDVMLADLGAFIFVGIVRGGDTLAHRLSRVIAQKTGYVAPVYHIDITLYRDDLYTGLEHPTLGGSELPLTVEGQKIVLVDDVIFTGRTIRSAIQEIMDYGRPEWIKLVILVDRGSRELPIQPDFVAQTLVCSKSAKVQISLQVWNDENDEVDAMVVEEGAYE